MEEKPVLKNLRYALECYRAIEDERFHEERLLKGATTEEEKAEAMKRVEEIRGKDEERLEKALASVESLPEGKEKEVLARFLSLAKEGKVSKYYAAMQVERFLEGTDSAMQTIRTVLWLEEHPEEKKVYLEAYSLKLSAKEPENAKPLCVYAGDLEEASESFPKREAKMILEVERIFSSTSSKALGEKALEFVDALKKGDSKKASKLFNLFKHVEDIIKDGLGIYGNRKVNLKFGVARVKLEAEPKKRVNRNH